MTISSIPPKAVILEPFVSRASNQSTQEGTQHDHEPTSSTVFSSKYATTSQSTFPFGVLIRQALCPMPTCHSHPPYQSLNLHLGTRLDHNTTARTTHLRLSRDLPYPLIHVRRLYHIPVTSLPQLPQRRECLTRRRDELPWILSIFT